MYHYYRFVSSQLGVVIYFFFFRQDYMISAVIHLANKDYASLVDDFIRLKILPEDCDRAAIIPLMDKVRQ